ncbi:MAG: serine/threonine-protein kinase [Planctomycetota bacterium]
MQALADRLAAGESLRDRLVSEGVLSAEQAEGIEAQFSRTSQATLGGHAGAKTPVERASPPEPSAAGGDSFATQPPADAELTQAADGYGTHATHAGGAGDPLATEAQPLDAMGDSQRFRVLRVLQQGGLGRVSVAADGELKREIALKEILPHRADDPEQRRRFVREAEITGALEHPGVVPVYSLGAHADGRPYYAMRLVRGEDLQHAIADFYERTPGAEQPLRFRQLLARFVDVCQTLDYAHSRGVLHRDLKPSNIMLGDYGETLVVDWGLAKASGEGHASSANHLAARQGGVRLSGHRLSGPAAEAPPVTLTGDSAADATVAGLMIGTPAYMSPEQAEGRLDLLGAATDVYCLGATLYHLLTGAAPLEGKPTKVLADARAGRITPPRQRRRTVPKPLEAICTKAMALRIDDRYATAGELALDVERFLADEPVTAYREPLPARLGRWARNHRGLVLSVASAATVAIATLGVSVALLTSAYRSESAARELAKAEATEAARQRDRAETERARAEANFADARRAVQDYYVTISEQTLLNQPGMQPLRDKLLRQALAYYQKFLRERADDPSLVREVALAHYYTGQITEAIDSPADAAPRFDRSIELLRPLATEGDRDALGALARSVNARGRVRQKLGELPPAADAFAEAVELRRKLVESDSADAAAARELANSIMNLAVVRLQQGEAAAALGGMRRAQSLRRLHVTDQTPADDPLRRDLAQGDYNAAGAHLTLGELKPALEAATRAERGFAAIAEAAPRDAEKRLRLAQTRRLIALVRQSEGDPAAAAEAYRQAADSLRPLMERNPDVVAYAANLAGVQMDLAGQLAGAGDRAAALEEIEAAVASLTRVRDGLTPQLRRDLAVAYRFWGEQLAAANNPEAAAAKLKQSRDELIDLLEDQPGDDALLGELSKTDAALAEIK